MSARAMQGDRSTGTNDVAWTGRASGDREDLGFQRLNRIATCRMSAPGDAAEREADLAATRVMRGERATITTRAGHETDTIRREADSPARASIGAVPAVAHALDRGGAPLDAATRAAFEPRFGRSFADVRVHTDAAAASAARAINARAFTLGRDIGFARDRYSPDTHVGRRLIAHELAHVAQGGDELRREPDEPKTGAPGLAPAIGISWPASGGGITFGPIYEHIPPGVITRAPFAGKFGGHLISYERRVIAFGVHEYDYMKLAEHNTGLRSINIQDRYNIDFGRGSNYFRGERTAENWFGYDQYDTPASVKPLYSGMLAQEALEGRIASTVHFNLLGITTLTPALAPATDDDPFRHMPGMSSCDTHSSCEPRQAIAHLAATEPGERRVTMYFHHEDGVTVIGRDSNTTRGALLPERFRLKLPNIEHVDTTDGARPPTPPPRHATHVPPEPAHRNYAGAANARAADIARPGGKAPVLPGSPSPLARGTQVAGQIGTQVVPGAAEGMIASESVGLLMMSRGFGTIGGALLRSAGNPLIGLTGAVIGVVAGRAASSTAKEMGAEATTATAIGTIGAMVSGAGAGAAVAALALGAAATGPLIIAAAVIGALSAGASFLMSKL